MRTLSLHMQVTSELSLHFVLNIQVFRHLGSRSGQLLVGTGGDPPEELDGGPGAGREVCGEVSREAEEGDSPPEGGAELLPGDGGVLPLDGGGTGPLEAGGAGELWA